MTDIPARLDQIVDSLCVGNLGVVRRERHAECAQALPSPTTVLDIVEALRSVLFPGYYGVSDLTPQSIRYHLGSTLDRIARPLSEQIQRGLCFTCGLSRPPGECQGRAREVAGEFLSRLPRIQDLLAGDVEATYEGDPALVTPDEAIFCYPGVRAVTSYRLAHELHQLEVPLLPRMITESAHSATGIDIHPGASIGERIFIDHGTGVVIGETCNIGNRVRIYQGVTLGAKSFPLDEAGNPIKGIPRHPIVEDDVVIYSGATILGRITIGRGSTIGGNVWLTSSVPAGSRVVQSQPRPERFVAGAGI